MENNAGAGDVPVARVGKYRLIAKLGQGGMADVFLAVAEGPGAFNKLVVIKRHRELAEGDPLVGMFLDEAKLAAQLNHPNIVHTYEVGEEDGAYFIAMEYLEGQTLSRVLKAARAGEPGTEQLDGGVWLHVVCEILNGLHYAHEFTDYGGTALGIVHRDVSPNNIFVSYDGAVKVLDFGIAKAAVNAVRTETGVLKGKAAYMAPEQARGSRALDRRADVFAAGIILWEAVAKRRLLESDALANLRRLVSDEPMPRLSSVVPTVWPELDAIVARALESDPDKRFHTAQEMRDALLAVSRAQGGSAVSAEVVAARMLGVFAQQRAEMRARVKRVLDERGRASLADARASVPTGLPRIDDTDGSGKAARDAESSGASAAGATVGLRPAEPGSARYPGRLSPTPRILGIAAVAVAVAALGLLVLRRGPEGAAPVAPVAIPLPSASAETAATRAAGSTSPGKTCQGTLRVRITTDTSGSAQDIARPFSQAVYDYLREVKASGGIRGCDIDVDIADGHYDAAVTQTQITTWAARPEWPQVNALFVFGTGPTKAVAAMPAVAGKTIFPGSYAGEFTSPEARSVDATYPEVNSQGQVINITTTKTSRGFPSIFFPATDYSTGIRIAMQAAWKIQPGKLAMAYDKTCAYCTDPLAAGKSYLVNLPGMELAADIDTIPQTSDTAMIPTIAAAVKAALDKDAAAYVHNPLHHPIKWLWCGNSVTSCAGVAKGAGQANAHIKAWLGDASQVWRVRVIANNWGIGETSSALCATVGSAADCDDVLYGLFPVPRYGDTSVATGMLAMMKLHDKWARNDDAGVAQYQDVRYVQGYASALTWRKAVEAALDAGHASPTGDDLREALESFKNVDLEGMTAGPVSFEHTDHRPQGNEWIYYLHQGALAFGSQTSLKLDKTWLGY